VRAGFVHSQQIEESLTQWLVFSNPVVTIFSPLLFSILDQNDFPFIQDASKLVNEIEIMLQFFNIL